MVALERVTLEFIIAIVLSRMVFCNDTDNGRLEKFAMKIVRTGTVTLKIGAVAVFSYDLLIKQN